MLRLLVALAIMFPSFAYGYECSREIDRISREIGIPVYCNINSIPNMSSDIVATNPSQSLIDTFESSFAKFVYSYNRQFLKKYASSMNFVSNLFYDGSRVGGLSNGKYIYISLKNYDSERLDTFYLRALNHEFSSNIYRFLSIRERNEWAAISNSYDTSSEYEHRCLSNGNFYRQNDTRILREGFLSYYAITNPENDFNVYAERLFGGDDNLKNYAKYYPKVKIKLELIKKIYIKYGFVGIFPDETWQTTTTILVYHHSPARGH